MLVLLAQCGSHVAVDTCLAAHLPGCSETASSQVQLHGPLRSRELGRGRWRRRLLQLHALDVYAADAALYVCNRVGRKGCVPCSLQMLCRGHHLGASTIGATTQVCLPVPEAALHVTDTVSASRRSVSGKTHPCSLFLAASVTR